MNVDINNLSELTDIELFLLILKAGAEQDRRNALKAEAEAAMADWNETIREAQNS